MVITMYTLSATIPSRPPYIGQTGRACYRLADPTTLAETYAIYYSSPTMTVNLLLTTAYLTVVSISQSSTAKPQKFQSFLNKFNKHPCTHQPKSRILTVTYFYHIALPSVQSLCKQYEIISEFLQSAHHPHPFPSQICVNIQ